MTVTGKLAPWLYSSKAVKSRVVPTSVAEPYSEVSAPPRVVG